MLKENLITMITTLKDKHKDLKYDLMEADAQGDENLANFIKKQKLKVKDEIAMLEKRLKETANGINPSQTKSRN